jgi:RNA polymerase sigma factor (sigma-70 family)
VLIDACTLGNSEAQATFQEAYGALIYTFPVRIYRLSEDEAGDFFLYVFEDGRIFKRARTFQGRNDMQFQTYLSYYVLRDLFLEWQRSIERVDMVSLEAPLAGAAAEGEPTRTVQDILPTAEPTPASLLETAVAAREVEGVLAQLDLEKRLVLKLLALGTVDLAPEDIRAMAQLAGRSIRETLECLEGVTAAVAAKAMKAEDKEQTLHTVAHWIHLYQRQMAALDEHLRTSKAQSDPEILQRLTHDRAELERKLAWRYTQQAKLREELQKLDIRPSYKDIATLLNLPLGTICSKIARAREEFGQRLATVRAVQT